MRLYCALTVDSYDNFETDTTDTGDPPEHGIVRLREFSIQGEPAELRRLAQALILAAVEAEQVNTP